MSATQSWFGPSIVMSFAKAESFMKTLKVEAVYLMAYAERLEVAWQRFAWCMGNRFCMGSILGICGRPEPLVDGADDSLAALVDVDVLDGDTLLAFPTVLVQSEQQAGIDAG
jgi:hypothetical protein